MRKSAVVIAFLLLGGAVSPLKMRAQDVEAGKERIRSMIRSQLGAAPARLPSMAIAVVQGDTIVWEEAFGWANQERRISATPATPYYLASVTKVFTGTALTSLANDGRIDLNRSVNAYLDSHMVRPALWNGNEITLQRVADHTAGLTTFNLDCGSVAPCRLDSVIDRFGVIVRPPGEFFDYSNLGYGILGGVIARTSKQSYGEVLRRTIFEPLGMRDCAVAPDGQVRGAAVRYVFGTTRGVASTYSATPAASTAYCSAHSLALFARALLGSSATASAGGGRWSRLLPTGGVAATQSGTPSGMMYSRGWWIQPDYVGTQSIEAQGGTSSGSALVRLIPAERMAVIVLANTSFILDAVADAAVDAFVPAIRERRKTWTPPPPFTRQRRPIAPDLIGTWVGGIDTYRGKRVLTLSIDATGTVTGSVDGDTTGKKIDITRAGASGDRVFGVFPEGDLGIDEATPGSYDLQLGLALYGSRLAGFATTNARAGTSAPTLSFLVELTRR